MLHYLNICLMGFLLNSHTYIDWSATPLEPLVAREKYVFLIWLLEVTDTKSIDLLYTHKNIPFLIQRGLG